MNYNTQLQTNNETIQSLIDTVNALPNASASITVDSALSDTSTNPVQNKVIKSALDGKSDTGHKHAVSDITSGTLSVERGGTGHTTIVDTTYTTARYRASALVNSETNPTVNGVINWIYE